MHVVTCAIEVHLPASHTYAVPPCASSVSLPRLFPSPLIIPSPSPPSATLLSVAYTSTPTMPKRKHPCDCDELCHGQMTDLSTEWKRRTSSLPEGQRPRKTRAGTGSGFEHGRRSRGTRTGPGDYYSDYMRSLFDVAHSIAHSRLWYEQLVYRARRRPRRAVAPALSSRFEPTAFGPWDGLRAPRR